jgi:hypothetical protein
LYGNAGFHTALLRNLTIAKKKKSTAENVSIRYQKFIANKTNWDTSAGRNTSGAFALLDSLDLSKIDRT